MRTTFEFEGHTTKTVYIEMLSSLPERTLWKVNQHAVVYKSLYTLRNRTSKKAGLLPNTDKNAADIMNYCSSKKYRPVLLD